MGEISHTGGTQEFSYTKEDSERIRSEDTDSTKDFKDAYDGWRGERKESELARKSLYRRLFIGIGFVVSLLLLLFIVKSI